MPATLNRGEDSTPDLLPRSATKLEHDVLKVTPFDGVLNVAVNDLLAVIKTQPPEDWLSWFLVENSLVPFTAYFDNPERLLEEGRRLNRIKGTPAAIEMVAGWLGFPGAKVWEEPTPTIHFPEFQLELDRVPDNLEILCALVEAINRVKPLRGRFRRVFFGHNVEMLYLDEERGTILDDHILDDYSGINLQDITPPICNGNAPNLIASFQREHYDKLTFSLRVINGEGDRFARRTHFDSLDIEERCTDWPTIDEEFVGGYSASLRSIGVAGWQHSSVSPYALGTLAGDTLATVRDLVQNAGSTDKNFYSTQNHGAATYVRNVDSWAYPLRQALTAVSPWNSSGGHRRAGVAITDRFVLTSAHYGIPTGAKIRFIEEDGTVVERTVALNRNHPDYSPYYPDLQLVLLDSPLPASITPAKVFPENFTDYLNGNEGFHGIYFDQEEKALVTQSANVFTGSRKVMSFKRSEFSEFHHLHEGAISGDSSNPLGTIINGELVVASVFTGGGGESFTGSGTNLAHFYDDLDALMSSMESAKGFPKGSRPQVVDLSGFHVFS